MSEEILSPSEVKVKFQSIADSEFAEKLQQDEFSALKGVNVSTSQTRHHMTLREETLNKIVERGEMDKTLANKLQETLKNRIQELRADEQIAQSIEDEEMAAVLQEKEDKKLANQMEEIALAEESSVKLARSLSRPVVETTSHFTRTGSGSMGRTQEQSHMSRSRTFGAKIESPVLNQKPRPLITKKSNTNLQSVILEASKETLRIGSVPQVGHPFLQTPEDQQLFREREMSLDGQPNPRPDPPSYSQINQSNLSLQSEPTDSDQSDSLLVPELLANSLPVPDQSSEEPTPLPPPPFSGVSPSKLRHNKKRK